MTYARMQATEPKRGKVRSGRLSSEGQEGLESSPTFLERRSAAAGDKDSSDAFRVESVEYKLSKWLDQLVEEARERPLSCVVSLTPDLARVLLNRNPGNRKMSDATVENYRREIEAGAWQFNGEPIIVSEDGLLNDGQHRCQAVIAADKPIDVVMMIGFGRDTRMTLNRGRVRTIGDYLAMEGHAYAIVLGGSANMVWQYRNRGLIVSGGVNRATKSEVLTTVAENPGLERSVVLTQQKGADAAGGKTILAFCHFIFSGVGKREDADRFLHGLITGAGLVAGDPILYARNRLINERGRLRHPEKAELLFRTWNAWRRGETRINRIPLSGGPLPALES